MGVTHTNRMIEINVALKALLEKLMNATLHAQTSELGKPYNDTDSTSVCLTSASECQHSTSLASKGITAPQTIWRETCTPAPRSRVWVTPRALKLPAVTDSHDTNSSDDRCPLSHTQTSRTRTLYGLGPISSTQDTNSLQRARAAT